MSRNVCWELNQRIESPLEEQILERTSMHNEVENSPVEVISGDFCVMPLVVDKVEVIRLRFFVTRESGERRGGALRIVRGGVFSLKNWGVTRERKILMCIAVTLSANPRRCRALTGVTISSELFGRVRGVFEWNGAAKLLS